MMASKKTRGGLWIGRSLFFEVFIVALADDEIDNDGLKQFLSSR